MVYLDDRPVLWLGDHGPGQVSMVLIVLQLGEALRPRPMGTRDGFFSDAPPCGTNTPRYPRRPRPPLAPHDSPARDHCPALALVAGSWASCLACAPRTGREPASCARKPASWGRQQMRMKQALLLLVL